jgi:four helix bundle protein
MEVKENYLGSRYLPGSERGLIVARNHSTTNNRSVADLRVYQLALSLEDKVYKLAGGLPPNQFDLSNGLRRAAAGAAHYIYESHRRYSYQVKIESLHAAKSEAEEAIRLLVQAQEAGFGKVAPVCEEFTALIKQSWGLIKYLQRKQIEKQTTDQAAAKDELVAARS